MLQKAENLVMCFNGDWDLDTMEAAMADRSADCEHSMFPASLGLEPKNNGSWREHFKLVMDSVDDCKVRHFADNTSIRPHVNNAIDDDPRHSGSAR
jgi:hypothetical protein